MVVIIMESFFYLPYQITYTWHRATDLYVVCIATVQPVALSSNEPFGFFGVPADFAQDDYQRNDVGVFFDETLIPDLVFHRIDLIPIRGALCRHFKQVAAMGKRGKWF